MVSIRPRNRAGGPVELFVKAGAARIKTESTAILFEDNATEFAYGAGYSWRLVAWATC